MKQIVIALTLAALAAGPALAHPGHVADDGHGHSHWLALAILLGLAVLAAGALVVRLLGRHARKEERHHG